MQRGREHLRLGKWAEQGQGLTGGEESETDAALDVGGGCRVAEPPEHREPGHDRVRFGVDEHAVAVEHDRPGRGHRLVCSRTSRSTILGSALPPPLRITLPTRNPTSLSSPAATRATSPG